MKYALFNIVVSVLILAGCQKKNDAVFRLVPSKESGVHFRNTLTETVDFNIFNYMYFYNGGGVAVGDVNGDSLPDVYFSSNQEANKLYLNEGNFKFRDVTDAAGVAGFNGWTTGVTMADVNADGKLDIYVNNLGDYLIYKGKNQLFINEGNGPDGLPIFTDKAMEFGLDLVGFSTQVLFLDYDRDGDLDMYMLNHSLHQNGTFGKSHLRKEKHQLAGDKFFRNDGGRFVDVTGSSGIYSSVIGYGLGVAAGDVNMDGWQDIYVGNDFHENDYLYINQKDGTFKEVLEMQINHTSRYTMGVDLADFNNDAFPDLISMDMLPSDPLILKASQAEDPYDIYNFKIKYGYNHQFARNNLQLNNRNNTFSEIAYFANVQATDWSWATFFADFNLDGRKDIFIANGILRRSNDLDYINFISVDSIQMRMKYQMTERELTYIDKMPKLKINNFLFINGGDSTFSDVSSEWGLNTPSYSNGAAYADLDNDGDLDLVVNNIEDEAFVYENTIIAPEKKDANSFLQVAFAGDLPNAYGYGAKVFLFTKGSMQMQECSPTKGYQSSVDQRLTFGTGTHNSIDSMWVIWNDGRFEKKRNVRTNRRIILKQSDAKGDFDYSIFHIDKPIFKEETGMSIPYVHRENSFIEFNREGLLPHMISAEGPACAIADVNNDGLEDIFLGGAKRIPASLFLQTSEGIFVKAQQPLIYSDSINEDVDAIFFDANGDQHPDLFVLSGGNEYNNNSPYSKPRLYLNNGKGLFDKKALLPDIGLQGSVVTSEDMDGDGDPDLFLGARSIPWKYGIRPDSYIFFNDGKGNFSDVTQRTAPELNSFGFVTDAVWADMNGDKVKDLVVAGEWSPIKVFINNNSSLVLQKETGLENFSGWWNSIKEVDIDGDGDNDLIAGNLGLNSKLKTSVENPVRMYVSDFDSNDSVDQIVTHVLKDEEYPMYTRDEMTRQMPVLKKKYLSYHKFAEASFGDIFDPKAIMEAEKFQANLFESSIIENLGGGKYSMRPLPAAVQFSPVNSILVDDFNSDGNNDLLVAGNCFAVNIQLGRYDASYGSVLFGNGKGHFKPVPAVEAGLKITGETRHLKTINVKGKKYFLAVRNNNSIKFFSLNN
jgi:enediyne biosynthesis protein E4